MRKVFFLFVAIASASLFIACSKQNDNVSELEKNIEARATSLGFPNTDAYKASVVEQCRLGNHENCDILSNGTHQACGTIEHSGKQHNGKPHSGSGHNVNHNHNGGHHRS